MNNPGTNFSTGMGAGIAIGIGMKEAEKAKQRRLANMGNDQILIETKMREDAVGSAISKVWDNWYYKDGKIYQKRGDIPFSFAAFAIVSFFTGLILFLLWFLFIEMMRLFESFPLDTTSGFIVSIIVGILFGIVTGLEDEEIDYIRITKLKDTTAVLIKIYDSSGYRNVDDDEILQISEQIEPIATK